MTTTSTPPTSEVLTTRDGVRFRVETMLTGLEVPWSLTFAPDGRLFITERPGRVRIATLGGSSELALTLDGVFAQGEAGLLGLALDPEFSQNRFVYLYYSATVSGGAVNRIVRYREVNSRLAERVVLLDGIPAATIHDGGRLRFGPDGLLYATAGDAANPNFAQDVASLAGKILRLNRDGTSPPDNRFSSPVYTYGHRNPQGLDWHPSSGDLWAVGTRDVRQRRGQRDPRRSQLRVASHRRRRHDARHGAAGDVLQPGDRSLRRVVLSRAAVPAVCRQPLRGHAARHAPAATDRGHVRASSHAQERLLEGTYGRLRDVVSGPTAICISAPTTAMARQPSGDDDRVLRLVPAS